MNGAEETRTVVVGHSPDSDDAFMFYALTNGKLETPGLRFEHLLEDIESLNQRALRGELEVSAVSIHAYAHLATRYALLANGCSMGDRYGPKLVARRTLALEELRTQPRAIAIPGRHTTAFLALELLLGSNVPVMVMPFDEILPAVLEGRAEVGLIIHEGQLSYPEEGLHQIADLGQWWFGETGLPLPLGGNVVRRDLGEATIAAIAGHIKGSIEYALEHREEALAYAMKYARGLDRSLVDRFVGMYVNQWTVDYGEVGRAAVRELLERAGREGLVPHPLDIQFVG